MKYGRGRGASLCSQRGPLNSAARTVGWWENYEERSGSFLTIGRRTDAGGLSFASSLAWMPFISSDQWDRNKMDTDRALGRSSTSSSFSLGCRARGREWALLSFSPHENRCRAGGQPTRIPIEYIKHTQAPPVRSVDVHALVSLRINVLK